MAAGAWRDYHGSIHARLPFVHSCTADAAVQEDLQRADERQERAARNLVQSFAFGAPGVGGGHRHAEAGGTPLGLSLGFPASSGLRDLGRGARTAQKERDSSAGALLNTVFFPNPPPPPPKRSFIPEFSLVEKSARNPASG
jgi:hypothetical protein